MITPALLELAADALRGEARRRRIAAERFAGEVRQAKLDGEIKDARTPALKVMDALGEAAGLEDVASALMELIEIPEEPLVGDGDAEHDGELPLDPASDPDVAAARSALQEDEPADPIVAGI